MNVLNWRVKHIWKEQKEADKLLSALGVTKLFQWIQLFEPESWLERIARFIRKAMYTTNVLSVRD